ncbi:MAG: hypothetical protein EB059_10385, partial [Alphaproteobacteria bacterium]|nr:hypothetical protein [Alphaproteobacteria bacterium]
MRFSTLLLKYLVLAVLILGAGMSDAEAKTKQAAAKPTAKTEVKKGEAAQQKGEWQVGMIKGEKGEFNYCLMRGEFNNDLSLAIALSPKQEINIGVGVP